MPSFAIETVALTRRFGARVAVEDVSLQVPAGMIYGFLGPNGAGKTTTIRLLLGLLRPSGGSVRLFGEPLTHHGRELLRCLGALVEAPSLYPHLTGRENLEVARRLLGVPRDAIDRSLATVTLSEAADRPVREFSLGMRQRLGLALALLGEPRLLVLDEPVNGLDPAGIHDMRNLLRRLVGEFGMTVFLSSHLLSEIELIADRVGIIRSGRLVFEGTLPELRRRQQPVLSVRVEPPLLAREILTAAGWQVGAGTSAELLITIGGSDDAPTICELLVRGGCRVSRLTDRSAALEDIFLAMTGSEGPPRGGA